MFSVNDARKLLINVGSGPGGRGSNPLAPTKFLKDLQILLQPQQGPNRVRGLYSDPDVALVGRSRCVLINLPSDDLTDLLGRYQEVW